MANAILTPSIIAREALRRLKNNLVAARSVTRAYEPEFGNVGSVVKVERPLRYAVTRGKTFVQQDVEIGSMNMVVDKQDHVGFAFDSKSLALDPVSFGDKFIEPAISQLAHKVDEEILALYKYVPNWAGTPGQTINGYADFVKGPERLDEIGVPTANRKALLSTSDAWALISNASTLQAGEGIVSDAYRDARLGPIAGVRDAMMSQQVATHTVGDHGGTPLIDGANQSSAYSAVKDGMTQTLVTDGWSTSKVLKAGDVFTIAGVFDVNPNTKASLGRLKQFTLVEDVTTASNAANDTVLTIYPAIIVSGPYQNASAAPADGAAITVAGTANTAYRQNLVFHPGALALAVRPLPIDPSMSFAATATDADTGLAVRIVREYVIGDDSIPCRVDILYGVKAIYPELATRLSGTA